MNNYGTGLAVGMAMSNSSSSGDVSAMGLVIYMTVAGIIMGIAKIAVSKITTGVFDDPVGHYLISGLIAVMWPFAIPFLIGFGVYKVAEYYITTGDN